MLVSICLEGLPIYMYVCAYACMYVSAHFMQHLLSTSKGVVPFFYVWISSSTRWGGSERCWEIITLHMRWFFALQDISMVSSERLSKGHQSAKFVEVGFVAVLSSPPIFFEGRRSQEVLLGRFTWELFGPSPPIIEGPFEDPFSDQVSVRVDCCRVDAFHRSSR